MKCFIDLRYVLPPLINLILLFLTFQGYSWDLVDAFTIDQQPFLMMAFLVLAILTFLLLHTSVKLPLGAEPIRIRIGRFSGLFALSLLASIIFPPSHFWVAYFILIFLSPWHEKLYNLFKGCLYWSHQTLKSIPTFIIICITQRPENPEAAPAQTEVGLSEIQDPALVDANGNQLADSLSNGVVGIDHIV